MNTASKPGPRTHTDSEGVVPSICVVALGLVDARARVLVHEVARAKKLAERRRAQRVDHAGLEVEDRPTVLFGSANCNENGTLMGRLVALFTNPAVYAKGIYFMRNFRKIFNK